MRLLPTICLALAARATSVDAQPSRTNTRVQPAALATTSSSFASASNAIVRSEAVLAVAYGFPLKGEDLVASERYQTDRHALGIQALGKDIVAFRHITGTSWNEFVIGNQTGNARYVVYNKPFYAMADGEVVGCWRNAPENPPGGTHPDLAAKKFAGGGNHLWILQTDGIYALYAHAIPGTIPSNLCSHNAALFTGINGNGGNGQGGLPDIENEVKVPVRSRAKVRKGQMLGRVGNSGASSKPHLHVHMETNGSSWPMMFERGLSTPFNEATTSINGPWTRFAGQQLPSSRILVWPARSLGAQLTFNGTPASEYQHLFDHLVDSGYMPNTVTCQWDGVTVRYNAVWIPSSGTWSNHFGLSTNDYAVKLASALAGGYAQTSLYKCNTPGGLRHVVVFRK